MSKQVINPKMEPGKQSKYRHWQHFHKGDYYYGECPLCGEVGQPDDGGYDPDDDTVQIEYVTCEACGCEFTVETATVYRFGGIESRDGE